MITLHLILIVLALVLFGLAAANVPVSRPNLLALGLFCWCLASVV